MEGSSADLRLQIADLLEGKIDLNQFQAWIAQSEAAIELHGSDAELDLLNWVDNLLAEYTGGHISASQFLDALRAEYEMRILELAVGSRSVI